VEVQVIGVIDNSDFAADSLFCEWAYVIDFDKNTFEVYKGFNKEPLDPSERFFHLTDKKDGEYYPVQHLKTYPLDELPTLGKFLEDLKDTDEEE
jgi:hypothetical protein